MSKQSTLVYLRDIDQAIEKIQSYTRAMSFEAFREDARTIDAVVRNIEIIGEAASHVPKEIQARYPVVPWKLIAGARNKMVHEYFGIDLEIVWKTVQEDLPILKEQISVAMKKETPFLHPRV